MSSRPMAVPGIVNIVSIFQTYFLEIIMIYVPTSIASTIITVDLVRAARRSDDFPKQLDEATLRLSVERYERFLLLVAKYPSCEIAPTRDIDRMWHLHMLHPRQYVADCYRLFGDILDHDGGFGTEEAELPILNRIFADTAVLWLKEYGEAYATGPAEISMTKCKRNCVSRCKRACKVN